MHVFVPQNPVSPSEESTAGGSLRVDKGDKMEVSEFSPDVIVFDKIILRKFLPGVSLPGLENIVPKPPQLPQ